MSTLAPPSGTLPFRTAILRAPERPAPRGAILLLAAIPVLDPILNQVNNVFQPSLGSFSMLQVVRCVLTLVLLIMIASMPRGGRIGSIVISIGVCLGAIAGHEWLATGSMSRVSAIVYGQFIYWLAVWYAASAWITGEESARTVIKGLVAGAVITAGSVYFTYVTGERFLIYWGEGVAASAGWFISGKGISGTLLAGAFLTVYLGRRSYAWTATLIAVLCLGASCLTYARAALVALGLSLAWLGLWSTLASPAGRSLWARRLIVAVLLGAIIFAGSVGTEDLQRRWSDVDSADSAGSGRLMLWRASVESFSDGTIWEKIFGRGIEGLFEVIWSLVGVQVLSHNDVLEMLAVGGLAGLLILVLLFAGLFRQLLVARAQSPEAAMVVAILLVLCPQMIFTGQLGLPDIMTFYLVAITAVLACTPARAGHYPLLR